MTKAPRLEARKWFLLPPWPRGAHQVSKLATSMLGITRQMYSVVLVGILISTYAAGTRTAAP